MMEAALLARGLSKTFGAVRALDSLDLTVHPGEIVCLLGANGAGKTTTINLFLGFLEPSAGEALVLGANAQREPRKARAALAYVPENVALYPQLSGLENLSFLHALSGAPALSKAQALAHLAAAGLDEASTRRRTSAYSKGMRQKVALAAAFARNAKAWLLDEPTSGLDPHAASELSQALRRASRNDIAILMATHDIFRARDLATRIGIMNKGRLVDLVDPNTLDHAALEALYLRHMTEKEAA
jgi:ABC-2 type transport system ATP-binding protein